VILFEEKETNKSYSPGRKVAILFGREGECAVLDVARLAAGDIAAGSNSWRGDNYEPALRAAVKQLKGLPDCSVCNGQTELGPGGVVKCFFCGSSVKSHS
jgi:hypothetical protein